MILKKVKDVTDFNFKKKIALLRVDFNVPIDNSKKIIDDTRIIYSLPTIQKIISDGGKIILISHLGRPKGLPNKKYSLKFLTNFLYEKLKVPIFFCENCIGKIVEEKIKKLKNKEILLLENLRFHKEEEKCEKNFAFKLSKYGDIYINDAFSVSHRNHSSITLLPKFFKKKGIGFLMKKEIQNISKFITGEINPPVTILLGGAKISSKIDIIEKFSNFSNYNLIIGGRISYPFIKEKGGKIGKSYLEIENNQKINDKIKKILNQKKKNIYFPIDVVISKSFNNKSKTKIVSIHSIPEKWMGLDIGPHSINLFCNIIQKSKTILWNGPMGVFEFSNFSIGTKSIAKSVSQATKNGSFSMVGGGDSISALKIEKCFNHISYVSTGGGAMLESLKNKKLPGLLAIMI